MMRSPTRSVLRSLATLAALALVGCAVPQASDGDEGETGTPAPSSLDHSARTAVDDATGVRIAPDARLTDPTVTATPVSPVMFTKDDPIAGPQPEPWFPPPPTADGDPNGNGSPQPEPWRFQPSTSYHPVVTVQTRSR